MAYTNIDKSSDYFNTVLYTGTGSELSISSLDFSPDWVWVKQRGADASHFLYDSVRGATKSIRSNSTNAEATVSESLKSFDSNGFTLGTSAEPNTSSGTYVGWSWRGSDSSASSNTDGSITSSVSANTTSGFSIVSYTGTGSVATVGHGLGAVEFHKTPPLLPAALLSLRIISPPAPIVALKLHHASSASLLLQNIILGAEDKP